MTDKEIAQKFSELIYCLGERDFNAIKTEFWNDYINNDKPFNEDQMQTFKWFLYGETHPILQDKNWNEVYKAFESSKGPYFLQYLKDNYTIPVKLQKKEFIQCEGCAELSCNSYKHCGLKY